MMLTLYLGFAARWSRDNARKRGPACPSAGPEVQRRELGEALPRPDAEPARRLLRREEHEDGR